MGSSEQQIVAEINGRSREIASALSELVRIPTTNPYSGDPSPAGEAAGQRCFEKWLREAGAKTRFIDVPADVYAKAGVLGPRNRCFTNRQSVVGEFTIGTGRGPSVILNTHMDVIGVADCEGDAFSGRIDGDVIHGRGASDSKGGLIAALFAVKALQVHGSGLNGKVIVESVVDEECNGSGAGTLSCIMAGVKADYAIVLDGTVGRIIDGCQGIVTAEVTVRGRAGHGSVGGVSAIDKLRLVMGAFDRLAAERAATRPGARPNIGAIRAGSAPWTVPNRGWLAANVNYLYAEAAESASRGNGFCGAELRARLEALIREVSASDEWLAKNPPEIVWMKDVPPFRLADCPAEGAKKLLDAAGGAFEAAWGRPASPAPMDAWFDASHLARLAKIPTIGLGCGEPGTMHSADEYNRLPNVVGGTKATALTVARLLG